MIYHQFHYVIISIIFLLPSIDKKKKMHYNKGKWMLAD